MTVTSKYAGKDNYGRPKADYLTKIAAMDDAELRSECYSMIYQSARCSNSRRADWHWMVDACYDEASERGDGAPIYVAAYKSCYKDHARG
jgi:hypothetical protein